MTLAAIGTKFRCNESDTRYTETMAPGYASTMAGIPQNSVITFYRRGRKGEQRTLSLSLFGIWKSKRKVFFGTENLLIERG